MRKTFAALTLALLTVLALPLAAADLPTEPVPAVDVEIAEIVQTDVTPEAAGFDLEAVMDDGRVAMACSPSACDAYCKQHYGPHSFGVCLGGTCTCSV